MDISRIGFGAAALSGDGGGYGFGKCQDPQELVDYAFELGIMIYDTAPIYGLGQSEKILGKTIKNIREKIKIVSKSGVTWHKNKRVNMTNDPEITKDMLHNSLKDLDCDYIDHYMIHWPDDKVDIRYPLEVLAKAQLEGKIVSIGLCNTNILDLEKAREIVDISSVQYECNLFNNNYNKAFEKPNENFLKMGWGTFDKGILAGSVNRKRIFEKSDARSWAPWWKKSNWKDKADAVAKFKEEIFDYALFYSFKNSDISLCGAKTIEQLDRIKKSLTIDKTEARLQEIYDELNPSR